MFQDLRWAARYAYFDELWRGRARIVFDPRLEAVLRDGGPGVAHGSHPGLRDLVDALLPRTREDAVWFAVSDERVAAELGRSRRGTTFVPVAGLGDVVRRAHWDVALVDLAGLLDEDEHTDVLGLGGRTSVDGAAEPSLLERARSVIARLRLRPTEGQTLVLSAPVRDYPRTTFGLDYGDIEELAELELGGGRIYGMYLPSMAAMVDFGGGEAAEANDDDLDDVALAQEDDLEEGFGEVDPDDLDGENFDGDLGDEGFDEDDVEPSGEADDEDVPLAFDNTLGSQEPPFREYVIVAGDRSADAGDGVTLLELPEGEDDDETETAQVRAQLGRAQRQADLAAIDRQQQLELTSRLQAENEALREEVEALKGRLARALTEADGGREERQAGQRFDAALVREQALRWRVGQLEHELGQALAAPVSELEAELAAVKAELAQGDEEPAPSLNGTLGGTLEPPVQSAANGVRQTRTREPRAVRRRPEVGRAMAVIRAVEGLVRRLERGGIGTLELRRQLVTLRRRLQP